MKTIKFVLFNFLFLTCSISLSSQCDSIVLNNQQDVNQFISRYGKCKVVNYLIIHDDIADISQLDSLYPVEEVKTKLILDLSRQNKNTININGLGNIKHAKALSLIYNNMVGSFQDLESVETLGISGYSQYNNQFQYFPNLKHIENTLGLIKFITDDKTTHFTTGKNFNLKLYHNIDSTSLKVLSNRIKKSNLKKLTIFPTDSLDLRHLSIIDSIEYLKFAYCANSNFSNLSSIVTLKSLQLHNDYGNNIYGDGLKYVDSLDYLELSNNRFDLDYKKILPNLKSINGRLGFFYNDVVMNLKFLDNVSPPLEPKDNLFVIRISDNKRLNDCNTSFLCEALARYPNLVEIYNNGPKCTKEEILKYCQTVHTAQVEHSKLVIGPNPTFGYLNIQNIQNPVSITIYDMMGQVVKTLKDIHSEVDIDDLPAGMYIFDIRNKEISERHKIIKID